MSLTKLFDGVRGLASKRETESHDAFVELARKLAGGKTMKPADVEMVLSSSGRPVDELQRLVSLMERMATLREQVDDDGGAANRSYLEACERFTDFDKNEAPRLLREIDQKLLSLRSAVSISRSAHERIQRVKAELRKLQREADAITGDAEPDEPEEFTVHHITPYIPAAG